MKSMKIVLSLVLISFLTLAGCKKAKVTFQWLTLEAIGSYDSTTDQSYLSLSGFMQINQSSVNVSPMDPYNDIDFLNVELQTWGYVIREGDDQVLLINGDNVYKQFGNIFVNASEKDKIYVWAYVISETPIKGDIFKGRNPDSVDVVFQMVDDNGNLYRIVNTVDMQFTRK